MAEEGGWEVPRDARVPLVIWDFVTGENVNLEDPAWDTPKRPTHSEIINLAAFTPVKPFRVAGTTTGYPLNPSTASTKQS